MYKVYKVDWIVSDDEIFEKLEEMSAEEIVSIFGPLAEDITQDAGRYWVLYKLKNEPRLLTKFCQLPEELLIPREVSDFAIANNDLQVITDWLAQESGYYFYSYQMSEELLDLIHPNLKREE